MTITEVARHHVPEQSMEDALKGIEERVLRRWQWIRDDGYSDEDLQGMRDHLLDHAAARTVTDPQLDAEESRLVLRTAGECALGWLDLGSHPDGDQEIALPLIGESISSDTVRFGDAVEHASTARDWLEAFALCLAGGLFRDQHRPVGLVMRGLVSTIHDGVPYSKLGSTSDPAELAEMDTLACYLTKERGHLPRDWPATQLCMPDIDERLDAALRLNALPAQTPDQQLLRALLEDNQPVFEQALAHRLVRHREAAPSDAPPRSLLPHRTIALAALAVQVHGWELRIHSAYLPNGVLRAPEEAP